MDGRKCKKKKVVIIGAGSGGLTAGMILSGKGYDVEVYEKQPRLGGRNGELKRNGYRFDIGPTFLLYKDLLDEIFNEAGVDSSEFLTFKKLSPMYDLWFKERRFSVYSDPDKMEKELNKFFPAAIHSYRTFRKKEKNRFDALKPCLGKHYSSWKELLDLDLIKALPYLGIGRSVFSELNNYFKDDDLTLSFCFQSKYLGMSAWDCPAMFGIIPHLEHEHGIYHVQGGLNQITEAMAQVIRKNGGKVKIGHPVKRINVESGKVEGITLETGENVTCEQLIINSDFAYSMTKLFDQNCLQKYKKPKIDKFKYSCSTFMLHLGLNRIFDVPHHNIVFANDYKTNVREIFNEFRLSTDFSFYVRNASVTDNKLAPPGHSSLYILVPVPNLSADVDWDDEKIKFRDQVLKAVKERLGLYDLEKSIKEEIVVTPKDWERRFNVYKGATFNLSHSIDQVAMFRPTNAFKDVKGVYLVGGGTHPGSGLPTIYESGRIAANLIQQGYH